MGLSVAKSLINTMMLKDVSVKCHTNFTLTVYISADKLVKAFCRYQTMMYTEYSGMVACTLARSSIKV